MKTTYRSLARALEIALSKTLGKGWHVDLAWAMTPPRLVIYSLEDNPGYPVPTMTWRLEIQYDEHGVDGLEWGDPDLVDKVIQRIPS